MFNPGTNSRLAVLESWKIDHDRDCERRYLAIEKKLEKIDQQFDGQTADFRIALKEHSAGIYKLLWPLLLMVMGGMATMIYNLLPGLHLVK